LREKEGQLNAISSEEKQRRTRNVILFIGMVGMSLEKGLFFLQRFR